MLEFVIYEGSDEPTLVHAECYEELETATVHTDYSNGEFVKVCDGCGEAFPES